METGLKSDVVIVGGVAAGPKTAATLARRKPDWKITLFERGEYISYGTCGMPYFASGDISSFKELTETSWGVPRSPEFFDRAKGFSVVTRAEVVAIDRHAKVVTVRNTETGEEYEHGYGKLVLATGSRANAAPFPVDEADNIRHFTRPSDAIAFRRLAEQGKVGEAIVIGGGFIGCELAEAAGGLWGIQTTLIECENQVLPYALDSDMASLVETELRKQDVSVLTGSLVKEVRTAGADRVAVSYVSADDSGGSVKTIEADYVFLCVGMSPESTVAAACGLEVGATGGLRVNQRMQTSDANIYAGGDCVESFNLVSGRNLYLPMGSLANRHGRVIAESIAGNEAAFRGVVGAFLVKVFDVNVGTAGLSQRAAADGEIEARAVWGAFSDRPDYYPEHASIVVKMVYDPNDMRLLGLQVVGRGDVCRRIDTFSVHLQRRATVTDLFDFEHGYAPPYAEALDPLHQLAGMALAQERGTCFISNEQARRSDGNVTWLDVREPDEAEAAPLLPGGDGTETVNIPLADLRGRMVELPPDGEILIFCRRGPRAYQAALMLQAAGFENIKVVGGGTTALVGEQE